MLFDEEYFKSSEFQHLLSSYESSLASGDTLFLDADDLVDIADYYNMKDEPERAIAAVRQGLALYPHHVLLNVFMARRALEADDAEKATRIADRIDDKDAPDYHYLRAEILIAQDRIEEADQYLREYAKSVDADEYGDFVKDVANLYIDYSVGDKAYEWIMRSTGDDSEDFKELLARALFGVGRFKESERLFNELIDKHPFSKRYWTALATAQYLEEDYNASVTSSEYVIAIDPKDPDGLLNKANGLMKLNNFEEALEYFRRFTEVCPDDPLGPLHQAVCLEHLKRTKEAIPMLQKAIALATNTEMQVHALQELAFAYSTEGELDRALDTLNRTEDLDCDHDDLDIIRGHILLSHQQVDEAEKVFGKILTKEDVKPQLILRIIVSLYDNRYVKAAYLMLKNYYEHRDKEYTLGTAYMALFCWELRYDEEFVFYLQKAIQTDPDETRLVLGQLFPDDLPVEDYYNYIKDVLK